jgi:mRNA-degrading endonuclease RelE of RelBE toxin-antitoxin system
MKLRLTERLRRSYEAAPVEVRKAFEKQSQLLTDNLHHPSLRAKKCDQARDIWQARVTRDWRFYFMIQGDTCIIIGLKRHPK